MIRSEDEYQAAHRRLSEMKRQAAAEESKLRDQGIPAEGIKRALDPWRSFMFQLEEEMEAYEKLKRGEVGELVNLHELGTTLVALRIAAGLTQRELADGSTLMSLKSPAGNETSTTASRLNARVPFLTHWAYGHEQFVTRSAC